MKVTTSIRRTLGSGRHVVTCEVECLSSAEADEIARRLHRAARGDEGGAAVPRPEPVVDAAALERLTEIMDSIRRGDPVAVTNRPRVRAETKREPLKVDLTRSSDVRWGDDKGAPAPLPAR